MIKSKYKIIYNEHLHALSHITTTPIWHTERRKKPDSEKVKRVRDKKY